MRKHLNRKGFTTAEVLIVVAIIVVLMGVGFVALMSHMRNMRQLEMDGHAKEIFVAAQNHLSMAKSQDYLGVAEYQSSGARTDNYGFVEHEETDDGIYYIVVNNAAAIEKGGPLFTQMLPFASVDETARAKGSYIIRYQKDPGVILDVFYSEPGSKRFAHTLTADDYGILMGEEYHGEEEEQRKNRREYGEDKAVIGWYGGGVEGIPAGDKLKTPGVEIENGDKLLVRVTNYNGSDVNGGKNALNLIVKCGGVSIQIPLIDKDGKNVENSGTLVPNERRTNSGVIYTVVLDDVTAADLHFAQLRTQFPSESGDGTNPLGSDIQIYAVAYSGDRITNVAQSQEQTTNSLFAYDTEDNDPATVKIASIRHLLNLDYTISGVNVNITGAEQISDLIWDDPDRDDVDFLDNTRHASTQIYPYNAGGTSVPGEAGSFMPVTPYFIDGGTVRYRLTSYNGQGHSIRGVTVSSATSGGLFAALDGCSVTDLELVDFSISASGNAGALAGSADNATITGVLVHNSKTGGIGDKTSGADIDYMIESTTAAAGGLIGSMNGGKVDRCAAAVYVQGKTNVGGLIGGMTGGTVSSSYSGGHTQNAKYQEATVASTDVYTIINVISDANAGGLIGQTNGTDIEYSYSTASSMGSTVGGLVGASTGGTVENCYAVGLVNPTDGGTASSLVGSFTSTTFSGDNNYLEGVSGKANNAGYTSISAVSGVSAGANKPGFLKPESSRGSAYPYDKTLVVNYGANIGGRDIVGYFFPTIDQLSAGKTGYTSKPGITDVHYGDWQVPGLVLVDYLITNDNTLDLKIGLKENVKQITLAVTGENSRVTRTYLLEATWTTAADNSKSVTALTVQKEGAVKNNTAIVWNAAAPSPDPFAGRVTYGGWETVTHKDNTTEEVFVIHISLDDITKANGQFAKLFANDSVTIDSTKQNLFPGENITVRVGGGEAGWPELSELKAYDELTAEDQNKIHAEFNYCPKTDNSLFGKATALSTYGGVNSYNAAIVNIRHLQNLDVHVSNISSVVAKAELQNSITWSASWNGAGNSAIQTYSGALEAGLFNGIYSPALKEFDGKNYEIANLAVGASRANSASNSGIGNAGLFRLVTNTLTVKNLHLSNPAISTATGYAGAIVAENRGTLTLDTVLAESATADIGGTTAGGLVGVSSGTSLTIKNSAASLYVTAASGAAGGLLGQQSGGKVEIIESYVGGHTEDGIYFTGSGAGRWNIVSNSGAAGGLIGETDAGTTTGIEKSFNAASVYSGVSNKAGGIVGNAQGSFVAVSGSSSILDLVYTVAPVYSVKTMNYDADTLTILNTVASGTNGAVFGNLANPPAGQRLFYLADVYADAKFNQEVTASNISYIGVGNLPGVKLASYYADRDSDGNLIGDSAAIIGLANSGDSLEFETDAYDEKLIEQEKEYPFSIWTKFAFSTGTSQRHFYGDWQPVENDASKLFKFYFLKEEPEDALEDDVPIVSFGSQTGFYQMAVLMVPFGGADLPIPTIPYIPGFDYGTEENPDVRWTVYYGDQRDALMNGSSAPKSTTTYKEEGGTVELQETDLQAVMTETYGNTMTFVAHYYDPGDQYIFRLMDYDPTAAAASYHHYGAIQVIQPSEAGASVSLSSVYPSELFVPRRNQSGYHFLGWYTQPTGGTQVFGLNDAKEIVLKNNISVNDDLTLYAQYQAKEETSVTVKFVLKEGENEYPLDAEYQVKFDKNQGLNQDITLPGEVKGVKVEKTKNGTTSAAGSTEAYFKAKEGVDNQDISVHLSTSGADCPDLYTIYIEGSVDTVYYAVVHVLNNTDADGSYSATDSKLYQIDYVQTLSNTYPVLTDESFLTGISGFSSDAMVWDVAAPSTNFDQLKTKYSVEETHDGKPVQFIFELTYDREQHWLVFTNTGDSYYPPEQVYAGQPLAPYMEGITDPTYTGYTFQGWVTGTDDAAVPEEMPNSDLTVRAKWKGALVDYTILVWLENAEDEGYTLAGDLKRQAYAGDRLTVAGADSGFSVKAGDGAWESVSATNYEKLSEIGEYIRYSSSDSGVEVRGNGGTILNVYYDRKIYTIRFDIGFARSDVDWGYSARTEAQALASHEQVYGLINGSYVPLKYVNNQWTYSGMVNVTNEYTGTRYKEEPGDQAVCGIVNGVVVQLTKENGYVYSWQYYRDRWRGAENNTTLYEKIGNEYQNSGLTTSSVFSVSGGITEGSYYIYNNNAYRNARTNGTPRTEPVWRYNGVTYTGQRYREGTDDTFNRGFVNGEMIVLTKTGAKWYSTVQEQQTGTYSDTLYLATANNPKYYVSTITSSNQGGGYTGFLTTGTVEMPGGFNVDNFNGTYIDSTKKNKIYFKDVTAKYGASIYEEWPAKEPEPSGSYFVGWIAPEEAWYWRGVATDSHGLQAPNSSVKGKIDTMNWKVIDIWENGQYVNKPVNAQNDCSVELHCRYSTGTPRVYIYRQYFWDPATSSYPSSPDLEYFVKGGSGSDPRGQASLEFYGYATEAKLVRMSNSTNNLESYFENADAHGENTQFNHTGYRRQFTVNGETLNAVEMRYRFMPHDGKLTFMIGETNTTVKEEATVYYNQPLAPYIPASITVPAGYTFENEWYDNEQCQGEPFFKVGDADYNSTRKMPDGDVRLYAKLTHNPVTVTFSLEGVDYSDGHAVTASALPAGMTSSYTVKYGYTLHEAENLVSGDTLDIFDANGEVLASFSPAANVDGYSFKYWCYRDGDTYKRFSYAYLLETNMTLYPMFGEDDVYADRPITIQYQLVDYSNNVVGTAQESVTASYRDAEGNLQFSAEGNIVVKDGDRVTYKAPDIAGYTHVDVSGTIYRVSEANHEIILRYRDASWKYDVEYYVQYENLENPASWVAAADYDEGADPKAILVTRVADVSAPSQYVLFGYTQPEVDGVNLTHYRFDHFVYDGAPSYDNFITLHPDAGVESGKVVVRVYLVPDQDSIVVDDIVLYYDGTSKTDYQPEEQPLSIPVGASTAVHYVYYKPSADNSSYVRIEDPTEVTHAGTYGVRAYITVTVGGTKYLVWQSELSSIPPLHLYIQRRVVVLISGSSTISKAALGSGYLTNRDVNDTTTSIAGMDTTGVAFGFVDGEGAEYTFSANAFRRMPGTSPNVFTYEVDSNTLEGDYNFFIFYGTLTVTD